MFKKLTNHVFRSGKVYALHGDSIYIDTTFPITPILVHKTLHNVLDFSIVSNCKLNWR